MCEQVQFKDRAASTIDLVQQLQAKAREAEEYRQAVQRLQAQLDATNVQQQERTTLWETSPPCW